MAGRVTGVDFAGFAVNRARRKARARGLDIDLRRADVTQLAGAGVDGPFDLVFDLGCFHGLDAEARERYALEAARVSGDGATYLLFAFSDAPFAAPRPPGHSEGSRGAAIRSCVRANRGAPRHRAGCAVLVHDAPT